jgi:hypothetical protein
LTKLNLERIEIREHINITAEEDIKHGTWMFTVILKRGHVDINQVRHQKCSFYKFWHLKYVISQLVHAFAEVAAKNTSGLLPVISLLIPAPSCLTLHDSSN